MVSALASAGLGQASGSGVLSRDQRRSTVARDTPHAAQTVAVAPLTSSLVATASVKGTPPSGAIGIPNRSTIFGRR
jgi:hypothetical protein